MKKILITLAICTTAILSAGEEVLYKSNFQGSKDLKGWFDLESSYKSSVPLKKPSKPLSHARLTEANGEIFLKGGKTPRGLLHNFSKPVMVDDNLKRITLKVVMRQTPKHRTTLIDAALTSRIQTAANGDAFWRGRDSGVALRGYTSPVQHVNYIYFRKDGTDHKKYRAVKPFNLFPKTMLTKWTAFSLTYDHEKKQIIFTCDGTAPLIYQNVDLKGMELNSLFVNQHSHDYKSIEVTCEKK